MRGLCRLKGCGERFVSFEGMWGEVCVVGDVMRGFCLWKGSVKRVVSLHVMCEESCVVEENV